MEIFESSDPARRQRVPAAEVQRVLRMPGKRGRFRKGDLGKGMVTDDTEMAICLARGLVGRAPSAVFPLDSVAAWYSFWFHQGGGFCGGRTCKKAFAVKPPKSPAAGESLVAKMQVRGALLWPAWQLLWWVGSTMASCLYLASQCFDTPTPNTACRPAPPSIAARARPTVS